MATLYRDTRELPRQFVPTYRDYNANVAIKLDLNSLCIKRPKETFFIQVKNAHLIAWGIDQNDLVVVEKGDDYLINDLLVLEKNGEYRFYQFFNEIENSQGEKEKVLFSLDVREPNLKIQEWNEVKIAGIITNVVHQMRNRTPFLEKRYAA